MRICLRLPRFVSLKLLHESSCLPTIKERLIQLGTKILSKMRNSNPLIKTIVEEQESEIPKIIRQKGQVIGNLYISSCLPSDQRS